MTDKVDISGDVPGTTGKSAEGEQPHQFGLAAAMALIVGSIIGVGIFNLPTSLAVYGPITLVSMALQLMVYATIFNINSGIALFPLQLLFCKFFIVITVVIGFIADVPDPSVMHRPPRKPGTKIVNTPQLIRWFVSGLLTSVIALCVLAFGPGNPSTKHASVSMTMAFAIVSLSAVNLGLVMRREREPAWSPPVFPYLGWIILGWILTWAAVELGMLQRLLNTESLTGRQWLVVLGLSLVTPLAVGVDKAIQLRRQRAPGAQAGREPTATPVIQASAG